MKLRAAVALPVFVDGEEHVRDGEQFAERVWAREWTVRVRRILAVERRDGGDQNVERDLAQRGVADGEREQAVVESGARGGVGGVGALVVPALCVRESASRFCCLIKRVKEARACSSVLVKAKIGLDA